MNLRSWPLLRLECHFHTYRHLLYLTRSYLYFCAFFGAQLTIIGKLFSYAKKHHFNYIHKIPVSQVNTLFFRFFYCIHFFSPLLFINIISNQSYQHFGDNLCITFWFTVKNLYTICPISFIYACELCWYYFSTYSHPLFYFVNKYVFIKSFDCLSALKGKYIF